MFGKEAILDICRLVFVRAF